MKIRLFCTLIVCFLIFSFSNAFGQAASFAALTGGVQSTTTNITSGQSQVVLIGFSATVSGGSITFSQFNIGWSGSTSQSHLANGTLYRCPTSSFSAATSTAVGNVTFSSSAITVNSLSETISSSTNYYFLVADAIYSSGSTDYSSQIFINTATFATDVNSTAYTAWISDYRGYTFNSGSSPYPVVVTGNTTGLASTATTLTSASSNVALFGFSITTTSNYSFTTVNINSSLSSLSTYFTASSFQLWSGTTSGFSSATNTGATVTVSGSYVKFSGTFHVNSTTRYYYLVATPSGSGTFPATVQFNLGDGQATGALTTSTTTYNDFTVQGNTYNINGTTVTVAGAQTGVLANGTTITTGQTGMALFGFGISAGSSISVTGFNINSTNSNLSTLFGNGKLYSNTSNTFSGATQVTAATVTFNGSYANVTFSSGLTVNSTTKYYFLVADNTNSASSAGTTVAFQFVSGQTSSAVTVTGSMYNTYNVTGNTYTLPAPSLNVIGANSTSANGITAGTLVYGQTDIVLFGFGVTGNGSSFTLNQFNIKTSGGENGIFANARLYRSTTNVFPGGTPLYTSSSSQSGSGVFVNGGGYFNCNVNETIPAGTTYYYWLVADYSVNFGTITSFTCDFASGQSSPAFITTSPYTTYNTFSATGHTFTIIASEYWTGALGNDFTLAGNFLALNGGNGVVPTSSMVVNIGGRAYITAPSINANTTVAGVTFGTAVANPVLNISAGKTLTISTALTTAANSNGTISGGTISLPSTATSNVGTSSTLTLSGTTVNLNSALAVSSGGTLTATGSGGSVVIGTGGQLDVAGTVTVGNTLTVSQVGTSGSPTLTGAGNVNISPAATLNVASGDVLYTALTGKLTLRSDSSGSASVGQITATSIAGPGADSIHVERFITGGLGHRGYYLMSSPVYAATVSSNHVYDLHYLIYGGMYLTGPVGFDKVSNPSLFLYREDQVPVNSFYSGNFWGVNTFNNTNPYDYNMTGDGGTAIYNFPAGNGYEVFFRGNRAAATMAQETLSSFLTAPTVTLNAAGTLNAGQIVVHDWFTPASANLSYTSNIANSAVRGFNLVGNPYASSIDWETFNSTSSATGIYGNNVTNTVYEYNVITHNYDTYQVGGSYTNSGSRTIVSGQGFFVLACGASPQLIFNESAKNSTQNVGANLFMSTRAAVQTASASQSQPHVRIQLSKDSINKDDTYIGFTSAAQSKYVLNEDALYHVGTGVVSFASLSADNQVLAINKIPLPAAKNDTVFFKVNATASGPYNLNMIDVASIPQNYQVWLHDAFTKDSVNVLQTPAYTFTINLSDTTTYGSRRFSLVIGQHVEKVLNFTATKSGKAVQLAWTTQNEGANTLFTVERSVDKGITFSAIGNIMSGGLGSYSLNDNNPLIGTDIYRVKLLQNSTITYSNTVSVDYSNSLADTHNLYVYPNPVKTTLNLVIVPPNTLSALMADQVRSISSLIAVVKANSDVYTVTIVNNLGAAVKKDQTNQLLWQTDVSSLKPGSYVIQVTSKNGKGVIGETTFIKL